MLDFTLTSDGATAFSSASVNSPVTIRYIVLFDDENSQIGNPIDEFTGNVTKDELGIEDNIVIDFSITAPNENKTIKYIGLKDSDRLLAKSEPLTIVKPANKQLKLRITGRLYTDADPKVNVSEKCAFLCTTIGLPYATKFRQGVVRLADPNMTSSGDTHKDHTVFTAQDTISKIEEYIHGANQYVPWDIESTNPVVGHATASQISVVNNYSTPTSTSTLTADSNGLVVSTAITGSNAVTTSPNYSSTSISTSAITGDAKLTTSGYIAALYSNSIDTTSTETDAARKLVTSHAVRSYVEAKDEAVVHLSGPETITGAKEFSATITANATITGDAVQSEYEDETTHEVVWNDSSNYLKLPTVEVVSEAISAVESAYQSADVSLQTQIDALNAGQNLADMVSTKAALDALPVTNLESGDKVQVLADETHDGASTVYSLTKPASGSPSWTYIGKYGQDSYTKTESDGRYIQQDNIATTSTIASHSSDEDYVPSVHAVNSLLSGYVKLTSNNVDQTISSPLVIKQNTSATATLSISNGQTVTANNTLTVKADNSTNSVTTVYDLTNKAYQVKVGSDTLLDLRKTTVSSTAKPDADGDLVASYRDKSGATLNDGRLVTVDYLTNYSGNMSAYAKKADNNTFESGYTNTFNGTVALNGTVNGDSVYSTYAANTWDTASTSADLVTVGAVDDVVDAKITAATPNILKQASNVNEVGSIGLFLYTEAGDEKTYGATINGVYLKAVGMSLPMSGQISYKAAALVPACSGTWKLLSLAVKRTATEPCLVMAQKISNDTPSA